MKINRITKIISIYIIFTLVFSICYPSVFAAQDDISKTETSQENVEFNVTINNSYESELDIEKGGELNIKLGVNKSGYIKDSKISFENANFNYNKIDDPNIRSYHDNVVELNSLNTSEDANIMLPITFIKNDSVTADMFSKESKIKFETTYVDQEGKEKLIKKDIKIKITWVANSKDIVSQNLIRYLKYDEKNTMISFEIKEGIENNLIPYTSKTITQDIPKLNNKLPINYFVTGDDIETQKNDTSIIISKKNKENDKKEIKFDSSDTFIVTYLYDTISDEKKFEVNTKSEVKTIDKKTINGIADKTNFDLKDDNVGNIVEANITGATSINKGYMYTNINRENDKLETEYKLNYTVNIGLSSILNQISIEETQKDDISTNKKVEVKDSEISNIFGEDGKIYVYDGEKLIGTLSKSATSLDINNVDKLKFVTSKPIKEGNISFDLTKTIKPILNIANEDISKLQSLSQSINIIGKNDNKEVSNKNIKYDIKLDEPKSNATIELSTENLSTITTNTNFTMQVTLEKNDISDRLFENPEITITLPSQIKNIDFKEGKLLYEDELIPASFSSQNNVIKIELNGKQTTYSKQSISKGAMLRIIGDVTVDNLVASSNEIVKLKYFNKANNETNEISTPVNIVAPTGFVTTNDILLDGQRKSAQGDDKQTLTINAASTSKEYQAGGTIVNNVGQDVSGFSILGRIPTKDTTIPDSSRENLNTSIPTNITKSIQVESDVQNIVYYSDNGDATYDLDDKNNNWTVTQTENTKSFLIQSSSVFANAKTLKFSYSGAIPEQLGYGQKAISNYAVYYDIDSTEGTKKNVVLATPIEIKTTSIPVITIDTKAYNYNTNEEIKSGDQISPDQKIKFDIDIKNSGDETATNSSLKLKALSTFTDESGNITTNNNNTFYDKTDSQMSGDSEFTDTTLNEETFDIGNIEPQTEKKISCVVHISSFAETNSKFTFNSSVVSAETSLQSNEFDATLKEGEVNIQLTSNSNNKSVSDDEKIDYNVVVSNNKSTDANNFKTSIQIPEGMVPIEINGNGTYNKEKNTIDYDLGNLQKNDNINVSFSLMATSKSPASNIQVKADATYDGIQKEVESNIINSNVGTSRGVETTFSSNISEGSVKDTDQIEYYLTIKNNNSTTVYANVSDIIPSSLKVKEYSIINGDKSENKSEMLTNSISTYQEIKSGENLKLSIITKPYRLDSVNSAIVTKNTPSIEIDGTPVTVNSLQHTVTGTATTYLEDSSSMFKSSVELANESNTKTNESNYTLSNTDILKNETYSISGEAYKDNNNNGRKDSEDERLSGIDIELYAQKQNEGIAKDINGNELKTVTNTNGRYEFTNIKEDNYVVVAKYDNKKYALTYYQKEGIASSENSDFIATKLNGEIIGATNVLTTNLSTTNNIDLGLTNLGKFDLSLDMSVSKITETNSKKDTESHDYSGKIAKTEFEVKYLDFATALIEYSIKVKNEGEVQGYAKSIIDYMPKDMTFSSELNPNWYLGKDNNLHYIGLCNEIINPGETKEVKLVLSKKMTNSNTGIDKNMAEIENTYNIFGIDDCDSISANKKDGEDDISSADAIILPSTGKEKSAIIGITIGIISLISLAVFEIKKHYFDHLYDDIYKI